MAFDPWTYAERGGKEHSHQTALFMWANMAFRFGLTAADNVESYTVQGAAKVLFDRHHDTIEQLKWLHAIHNQGREPGQAGRIRGAIAKAEGVKAGVSDMFLPVRGGKRFQGNVFEFAGFYLELKIGINTPSAEQLEFMTDMRQAGYAADWATGWLEARQKVLAYLQIIC